MQSVLITGANPAKLGDATSDERLDLVLTDARCVRLGNGKSSQPAQTLPGLILAW